MMLDAATRIHSADHPALRAWSEIAESASPRAEVEILKDRSACQAYRLAGLGPVGSNVIAKRYPESKALAEFRIYRNVLRHLPLISPQHYGLVKEKGTGLGLAMTKKMIEFWKGSIWFETEEGKGTAFFVKLPLVQNAVD